MEEFMESVNENEEAVESEEIIKLEESLPCDVDSAEEESGSNGILVIAGVGLAMAGMAVYRYVFKPLWSKHKTKKAEKGASVINDTVIEADVDIEEDDRDFTEDDEEEIDQVE